jgi:hypothetical protein
VTIVVGGGLVVELVRTFERRMVSSGTVTIVAADAVADAGTERSAHAEYADVESETKFNQTQ